MDHQHVSQQSDNDDSACLVCTTAVVDHPILMVETGQQFLKTVCEVVGIKGEASQGLIERYITSERDIRFCPRCQRRLEDFRKIHIQLDSLTKQVASIRQTFYEDLCLGYSKPKVSEFRRSLANEHEVRHSKSVISPETITADCVPNLYHDDDPCNDDDLPNVDITLQWNLKPCEIKLERVDSNKYNDKRKRKNKNRLEKLKNRKESKRLLKPKVTLENAPDFRIRCAHSKCRFRSASEDSLRFHTRRVHEGKTQTPYNCFECAAEFNFPSKLRQHELTSGHRTPNSDKGQSQGECSQCHRVFQYPATYREHLTRQGGECRRPPRLPLNGAYDETQKPTRRFVCSLCAKKFRAAFLLAIHIRAAHTDGFAFMCEFCSKPFNDRQTMDRHQIHKHAEQLLATEGNSKKIVAKVKSITCETCQKIFSNQGAKRHHVANVHSKLYSHYCEKCGSGWVSQGRLDRHIATVHTEQKKFQCPLCPLKLSRRDKLNRHIKVKHGDGSDKKFVCDHDHCGKAFFDNPALTRHLNLVHLLKRDDPAALKFKCDLCQYSCVDKNYLKIHIKSKGHREKAANTSGP